MTVEELRAHPAFQLAARLADQPLDLDGVSEVVYASDGERLAGLFLLEDHRYAILFGHGNPRVLYDATALGLAKQLLAWVAAGGTL